MSNEVAETKNNALAALSSLRKGVQNVRQALPTSSVFPILKLGKDGIWVYGQENTEVEEESLWAINPMSIQHGYVCWTDKAKGEGKNELLGEVYAPMTAAPIDPSNLQDHSPWKWKPATTMQLKCISGEDEGQEVIYKPSSLGGSNAMDALLSELEKQLDTGSDEVVPVAELVSDHYMHKQYGKTYIPQFDVKSFMAMDGVEAAPEEAEEAEEAETVEKPAKKKKPKKVAEPEQEVEDAEVVADAEDEAEPKTEGRTRRRRRAS